MSEALWTRMTQEWTLQAQAKKSRLRALPTYAQRDMAGTLTHAWVQHTIEMLERSTAHAGMEFRFPFEDRRLIEFGLALPEEQRWRGPWTKFVLRQAMEGRLPESVRLRRTKSDFSDLVIQSLLKLVEQGIFERMISEEFGWVCSKAARQSARQLEMRFRSGAADYTKDFWRLWMTAAIEMWARASFGKNG